MTDKEKIRAEMERRMKASAKIEEEYKDIDKELSAKAQLKAAEYQSMLVFIDSMHEDPIKEDLEEELSAYVNSEEYLNNIGTSGLLLIARHFADWQKSQLSKCSCELKILEYEGMPTTGSVQLDFPKGIFKAGEKIKLLIIKEDRI